MAKKFTSNYSKPTLSSIAINGNFNNPQHQIDQLNKNVLTDHNMTVGDYTEQMSGITGESNPYIYSSPEQYSIDSLNKTASTDPNMTLDDYAKQMSNLTGDTSYIDGISGQEKIDALNKTASTDPNLTVEEYANQMSEITGEPNKFTYLDEEQLNIDKLNKEAVSNPNMSVGDYVDQMSGITGEPSPEVSQGIQSESIQGNPEEGKPKYKYEKEFNKLYEQARKDVINKEVKNYSATEWEAAMKDPSKINMSTKEEVLDRYIQEHGEKIKETQASLEKSPKKKSNKNLTQSYEEVKNNSTSGKPSKKERKEIEEKLKRQQAKAIGLEHRKKRQSNKTVAQEEIEKLRDLKKNLPIDDKYMDSVIDIESQIDNVNKKLATQNKVLKAQSKASIQGTLKGNLSVFKVANTLFAGAQAINSFKESRAEGHGIVNSAVKGVGNLALTEALGPVGYGIYQGAKALPKAAIKGTNMLFKESRRMNSASNFIPLGGVNFQDSPELATMRQSGMELAKMSQYNLEQTLMGAEAKHLHR